MGACSSSNNPDVNNDRPAAEPTVSSTTGALQESTEQDQNTNEGDPWLSNVIKQSSTKDDKEKLEQLGKQQGSGKQLDTSKADTSAAAAAEVEARKKIEAEDTARRKKEAEEALNKERLESEREAKRIAEEKARVAVEEENARKLAEDAEKARKRIEEERAKLLAEEVELQAKKEAERLQREAEERKRKEADEARKVKKEAEEREEAERKQKEAALAASTVATESSTVAKPLTTIEPTTIEPTPTEPAPAAVVTKPRKSPAMAVGYLMKEGGNFKTWKNRFFILKDGKLSYYEKEDPDAHNKGYKEKLGELYLKGYKVTETNSTNLVLENESDKSLRKLLIRHVETAFIQKWKDSIEEHIKYCDSSDP